MNIEERQLTCLGVSHHFNAAAVAGHKRRLIAWQGCVVERVLAAGIRPGVAFVAVNGSGYRNINHSHRQTDTEKRARTQVTHIYSMDEQNEKGHFFFLGGRGVSARRGLERERKQKSLLINIHLPSEDHITDFNRIVYRTTPTHIYRLIYPQQRLHSEKSALFLLLHKSYNSGKHKYI